MVRLDQVLPEVAPPEHPVARIAVLTSLNFPDMTEETAALVRRFTRVSLETLVKLGAGYQLFDTSTALPDPAAVAGCDGLLLLGGGDIDGSCYGAAAEQVPHSYGVDARADRDAFAAIDAAQRADLPVFGICRGAQLINVQRGGTIIADIEDFALHRGGEGEPMFLDERITLVPGTRLQTLLRGRREVLGRSGHHQAVDRLGPGLVRAAVADDGIVEGFEDPDRWLVGVQWHPEDDDGPAEDRFALFAGFVEAAAAGRAARP